jgi:hypothetical protein
VPGRFPGVPYVGDSLAAVSGRVAWLVVSGWLHGLPLHLFELRCRVWHGTKARPYVFAVAALATGHEPWLRFEARRVLCCAVGTLRPDWADAMLSMLRGVHRTL